MHREMSATDCFTCRIDNSKVVTNVLSCLTSSSAKKDAACYVEVTSELIIFTTTGRSRNSQARASIQSSVFNDFFFESTQSETLSIQFVVSLNTLLDCLFLFGSSSENTALSMSFHTDDAIFKLSLEESGVLTTCDITSLYCDDFDDVHRGLFSAFRNAQEEAQMIVRSEVLREGIQELSDVAGATTVKLEVKSGDGGGMRLSTEGVNMSECEVEFPLTSDAFVSFRCSAPCEWAYALTSFQLGMKALSVAKETFIRVNSEGIMCIQHQLETSRGVETYVDFLMLSLDDQDDTAHTHATNSNTSSTAKHLLSSAVHSTGQHMSSDDNDYFS